MGFIDRLISPEPGEIMPAIVFKRVLFPEPFVPIKEISFPFSMLRLKSFKTSAFP